MSPRRPLLTALLAAAGFAAPAAAQTHGPDAPCGRSDLPAGTRDVCLGVAQAVTSVQPQLGILLSGGNPTLGSVSGAGLRLGISPGTGLSGKVNFVPIRLPDVLAPNDDGAGLEAERTVYAPAASATLSVNVFRGADMTPTVGGIGSVDLLGSVTWLPLRALDISSFRLESNEFTFGVGARLGVVRESFTLPGASVSVMYRRVSELGYGSVCRAPVTGTTDTAEGYRFVSGVCGSADDPGEFVLDLTSLGARGVLGKQLGQLGLAAGVGYDHFESDLGIGFRAPPGTVGGAAGYVARAADLEVGSDRWSAFGSASYTTVVTTFALELGWMQGGEALPGYPAGSEFDPERGTLFGSLGVRLSF